MIQIESLKTLVPPELLQTASQDTADSIIEGIAQTARDHWIKLASQDNSSFRFDYIKGIQEVRATKGEVVISLVGTIPHMLEEGAPSTDMRDILLNEATTPVVPRGERGMHKSASGDLYRAIPFRHTTPGTKTDPRGKTLGREMGSPYGDVVADTKKMGQKIYLAAKELAATKSVPGKGSVYGGRLEAGTAGATSLANKVTGTPHKTDIYAGMIREEKSYEKATQSTYKTFRIISEGVRDGSWIRSPIPARNYAKKVSAFAARLIPKAFEALGGE